MNQPIEIGSSDAPILCGVSPYETPWQWWARRVGLLPPREETEEMRQGRLEEPLILRAAMDRLPAVIAWEPGRTVRQDWLRATPDAIAHLGDGQRLFIEAKATRGAPPEDPRLDWIVQVQHQLMLCPAAVGAIIAARGALTVVLYDVIAPHPGFQAELRARAEHFRRLVETETPPPVQAEDNRWLGRAYPLAETLRVVQLPPESVEWDARRQRGKEAMRIAEREVDEAEAHIKAALGTARCGVVPTGTQYTYATTKRAGYTVAETTVRTLRRRE